MASWWRGAGMAPQDLALAVLINAVWGLTFIAAKVALNSFPALLATGLRFALVLLILVPFLRVVPGQMRTVMGIAVFAGGLHFALVFTGFDLATSISAMAVVAQLALPFATLIAVFFFGERIRWRRSLGIALAFAGVVVISFDPTVFEQVEAVVLVGLGALCMAIAQNLMRLTKGVSPMNMQAWIAVFSAPVLLALTWPMESGQVAAVAGADSLAWGALAFVAIGSSVIAHSGMFYLMNRYPVTLVAPLLVLAPIFGVLFAVWLLDEVLTWRIVIGASVTLAGVFIVAVREPARAAERL
ncbi:DMT family transporter [Marinibaculum pumilum]|uniref:DMT family transporter n=1 Tax=Marinibaculum pumilum TaxID=1766165 RepID=A0ABV7KXH2_9PROT